MAGHYWVALCAASTWARPSGWRWPTCARSSRGLGYRDVTTLLNSGNVVFRHRQTRSKTSPARAIEDAVKKRLGVSSAVIALQAAELDAILRDNPLVKPSRDPSLLLVAMVRDAAALSRLAALAKQDWGREELACGRGAGYIWCPGGSIAGEVFTAVNKALGDGVTTRNWSTMLKLQAMTRPTTDD